jgi:hypothetical protein
MVNKVNILPFSHMAYLLSKGSKNCGRRSKRESIAVQGWRKKCLAKTVASV